MIVYVDVVFIVNFIISFTFLLLIKFLVNGKESVKIIVFCSVISVVLLFSFFLNKMFYEFFKISGGLIVVALTLLKTKIIEKIFRIVSYYSMQFSLVGITNAFQIKGIVLLVCIIFLICSFIIYKYQKLISKTNCFKRKISIYINNKEINLSAYLDSGNMTTYQGNPIIYLDNKYLFLKDKLDKKITYINTVAGVIEKEIYYLKKIVVDNKLYTNVYIAFGNVENYDCLLNVMMR